MKRIFLLPSILFLCFCYIKAQEASESLAASDPNSADNAERTAKDENETPTADDTTRTKTKATSAGGSSATQFVGHILIDEMLNSLAAMMEKYKALFEARKQAILELLGIENISNSEDVAILSLRTITKELSDIAKVIKALEQISKRNPWKKMNAGIKDLIHNKDKSKFAKDLAKALEASGKEMDPSKITQTASKKDKNSKENNLPSERGKEREDKKSAAGERKAANVKGAISKTTEEKDLGK